MKHIVFVLILISNFSFAKIVVNDGKILNCEKQKVFTFNPEEECSNVDSVLTNGNYNSSITKTSIYATKLSSTPPIEFSYKGNIHNGYVAYIYGNSGTCTSTIGFVLKNCESDTDPLINASLNNKDQNDPTEQEINIRFVNTEVKELTQTEKVELKSSLIVKDNIAINSSYNNSVTLKKSAPTTKDLFVLPKILQLAELELIKINKLKSYADESEEDQLMPNVQQTDCPTFRPRNFEFFTEIYGGVSYSLKDLSIGSNSDEIMGQLLLELRDSSETSLETLQAGALIGAYHKKSDIAIMTGLQYSRIAEKLNYVTSTTVYDSIPDQILHYLVTLDGDTVPVLGTIVNETITTSTKKIFNDYVFLDIPFIAEINILHKRNPRPLFINAQVGINANINLSAKGNILDQNLNTVPISDIVKERINLSYFASVGLNYEWNDNIVVKIAPYFKYMPDEITIEEYELKQQYSLFGINLSARYYFNHY